MKGLLENINQIIHQSMKINNIPGAAVAVIKNNEVILSKGYGRTTVEEWGVPIRSNTLFRIASVSKLFTGTVMMMLVEKGLIDLDKPVHYYVPWFTAEDPTLSKFITIRMLLSHSSGLPTGGDTSIHYEESGLYHYMKEVVPTLPILFHPGTAYSYGNHALNIAGYVAEQVTNKTFASLMQEMLFAPLGMSQTTYNPLRAMTYPLALPHDKDINGNLTVSHQFYNHSASYPSYYAFSSIQDLIHFAKMHLQEGFYSNKQILNSSLIKEMRNQQSRWYTLNDAGCGITFFQEKKDGVERFWHYGQYSHQYSSQFILVPEKGIAVIALANGENIFQAGYEIIDELLKEDSNDEIGLIDLPQSDKLYYPIFEGSYLHSYYGLFKLYERSGKAYMEYNEQSFELIQHSKDTYIVKDDSDKVQFTVGFPTKASDQTINCIVVNSKACPEFKQGYISNPTDWQNWVGIFSDGRETYETFIQGESFIIRDNQMSTNLIARAIERNLFLTKEFGLIRFIEIKGIVNLEFDYAWRYPKIQ
jgi:CubicO group peptidase (beta-lactamase class C family)